MEYGMHWIPLRRQKSSRYANQLQLQDVSNYMWQNLFDVDALARQAEREEARAHDDKTFFEEVIAEIERGFTSVPQLKYNFIWYCFWTWSDIYS